ncbi:MAG: hypothetical protein LBH58_10260, partial [Tannerellaceae bacterium]|nr:hypothetical protein [Tannerellaceae bacterium]
SLGNIYGWGYVKITELDNNKIKVTFTPQYAYNYYSYGYWENIPKEEIIMDKPADNVININTSFTIDESELGGF